MIDEIDSVTTPLGTFGLPRRSVEYKWLANGEHYPALWVISNLAGGTETVSSVRYRDIYRDTTPVNNVPVTTRTTMSIKAYPNPAANGKVTIDVPADWDQYAVEVFDAQSRLVATYKNERELNVTALPAGHYLLRITSGANIGYAQVVR